MHVSDRLKRLKWCRERLHWSVEDWAKFILSNESNFEVINHKSRLIIKKLAGEKFKECFCVPRIQGGGGSVGIWGCFSHKGTGSYNIYNGRINQYNYKETLESKLLPEARAFYGRREQWIFQHDAAMAHTAISVKEWLDQKNITVMPWPAHSTDLNPIKNIWAWIDKRLVKESIASVAQLHQALEKLWKEFPRELCIQLVESMPRSVCAWLKVCGAHIKY